MEPSQGHEGADGAVDLLGRMPLFEGLDAQEQALLATRARAERFERGHLIFGENEPGDRLHVIRSGIVQVFVTDPHQGTTRVVAHVRRGDTLGETALFGEEVRSVSALALTEVETWSLARTDYEKVVLARPRIGLQMVRSLSQRLERSSRGISRWDHTAFGRLVPIVASEPKMGRTTLAINLAAALVRQGQGRVLLYDPNVACGDIAQALGISSDADYAQTLLRRESIDVEGALWQTKGGFHTLLPSRSRGLLLKELHLFLVLEALSERFDTVVVDSSSVLASLNKHILKSASRLVLLVHARHPRPRAYVEHFESVVLRPNEVGCERLVVAIVGAPPQAETPPHLPPGIAAVALPDTADLIGACAQRREIALLAQPDSGYAAAVHAIARRVAFDQDLRVLVPANGMPDREAAAGLLARIVELLGRWFHGATVIEERGPDGQAIVEAHATHQLLSSHLESLVSELSDLRVRQGLGPLTLTINGRPSRV